MAIKLGLVLVFCVSAVVGWQKASLDLHNKYRTCHAVPALALTDQLNQSAQRCANYLASIKKMDHVCNKQFGTSWGENLASGTGGYLGKDAAAAGITSTKMWYSEEPQHNYSSKDMTWASGHFSQIVWKGSNQLGMGYATNGDFAIVVAHYNPPGNYMGQFLQNVFRSQTKCV